MLPDCISLILAWVAWPISVENLHHWLQALRPTTHLKVHSGLFSLHKLLNKKYGIYNSFISSLFKDPTVLTGSSHSVWTLSDEYRRKSTECHWVIARSWLSLSESLTPSMSSQFKSWKKNALLLPENNNPIRLQLRICHDSSADVTNAKWWPG